MFLLRFDQEIGKLQKLKTLHLTGNNLTTLPPEIGHLTNLEELELGFNKIERLPPEIGELDNLRHLNKVEKSKGTLFGV